MAILSIIGIYLFAQAPAPLNVALTSAGTLIPVHKMLEMVAKENNKVRKQWTKQIVVAGKNAGLMFSEDWRTKGIDHGPLPALFLREVAMHLEKSAVPLSLFLGSDFPIRTANKFKGRQAEAFQQMRNKQGEAQFFFAQDVQRYTAMFADKVVVDGCATCHNEHPDSPKTDWQLNDIMGATTWAYPKKFVTRDEAINIISELRNSFAKAYNTFLEKTKTYASPPPIGEKWPSDGYFIPSVRIFSKRFENSVSTDTLNYLLNNSKRTQ